ncbi:sulfotransferase domain-containing protein [Pelagicoccus enzymogenes]|uniref:sulfotransferase domain-containing protein n=1 Tax=Pelagicoccus enzymogenes TaxID=2773457 RepID=UPI00280D0DEF|nr:sulfotransferase domain-containing protein [Pelagicoccus enzymogenes]MDQ8199803.1 sulfotransferase domain-containing protein [Pelagicoccus enzymogenes]
MGKITWIASYPKSGNTWLRTFLATLGTSGSDTKFDRLQSIPSATSRMRLEKVMGLDTSWMRLNETEAILPDFFNHLAAKTERSLFFKTHHAFLSNQSGDWILPLEATQKAVYLVRNPMDVAVSFSYHNGHEDFDRTIDMLSDHDATLAHQTDRFTHQLPHRISSWSSHVATWRDSPIRPLIVRYEDLLAEPFKFFDSITEYLEISATRTTLANAIERCRFEKLKQVEEEVGFHERPPSSRAFFRSGKSGDWRNHLSANQVSRIVDAHHIQMQKLGYLDALGNPR